VFMDATIDLRGGGPHLADPLRSRRHGYVARMSGPLAR
jgi:hypothetical protein